MRRRAFLGYSAGMAAFAQAGAWAAAAEDGAKPKIRAAQIGTGHAHAAGKMDAVRRLTDLYDVVGIAEADEQAWARASKSATYAGLRRYAEDELLALPGLQVVLVETKMRDSAATALRALSAGKHVHLDKPGALEHEEFKRMRREAERRGLTVQMGYMLRYNPAFELLFRAAREGWFGEILEIDCMMGKQAPDGMRRELAELPGGGMFELACHIIDATVTVLGRPQSVQAFTKRTRAPLGAEGEGKSPVADAPGSPESKTPGSPNSNGDLFADNQLAVLEYARATATVRCNHADPFGGPRRRFQVAGTRGAMEIMPLESGKCRLMLSEAHGEFRKGEQTLALEVPAGRYDGEFVDLARVVRGEKPLAWNAAHDIAVHETVLLASGAWRE